ncbi:InlB B-repeat-containing protein, partial [Methanimicrococcus blatticola]
MRVKSFRLIFFALLIILLMSGVATAFAPNPNPGGPAYGSIDNPLIIQNDVDFISLHGSPFLHYKLGNNIEIGNNGGWLSIGDQSDGSAGKFSGTFDGAGHTITIKTSSPDGVVFSADGIGSYGIFGDVYHNTNYSNDIAVISNLTVVVSSNVSLNSSTATESSSFGILVGSSLSSSNALILDNCHVVVEEPYSVNGASVGGLIGNLGGKISNCDFSGNIAGTGNNVGGIVGTFSYGSVTGCIVTNGNIDGVNNVGGIIGSHIIPTNSALISNCNFNGIVSGTDNIGGIAGSFGYGSFTNCAVSGTIDGRNNVGGFFGATSGTSILGTAASDITVVGTADNVGGLIGSMSGGSINDTHVSVDVTGVNHVGGLAGIGIQFDNASSSGIVHATGNNVGGIAGSMTGNAERANSSATVSSTGDNVGGLFGLYTGGNLYNSKATGSVSGGNSVGGGIGSSSTGNRNYLSASGTVTATGDNVGGLFGYIASAGNAHHFSATGAVSGKDNVGGLAGHMFKTSTTDSSATGNVIATGNNVGGFVGFSEEGGGNQNNSATGTVSGNENVGGYLGLNHRAVHKQVFSTGDVTGTNNVGGLGGFFGNGSLYNSYATGNVTGTSGYAGGLVGRIQWVEVHSCYATGNVTGKDAAGLIGLSANYAPVTNSLALNAYVNGSNTSDVFATGTFSSNSSNFFAWNGIKNGTGQISNKLGGKVTFVKSYNLWNKYSNTTNSSWPDTFTNETTVWKTDYSSTPDKYKLPILAWQTADPNADASHLLYLTDIKVEQKEKIGTQRNISVILDHEELNYSYNYSGSRNWDLFIAMSDDPNNPGTLTKFKTVTNNSTSVFNTTVTPNKLYAWGAAELNASGEDDWLIKNKTTMMYNVTFDKNAGTDTVTNMPSPNPVTGVPYNSSVGVQNIPERVGYAFGGWYTEPNGGDEWDLEVSKVVGDITLYAKWNVIEYGITYELNGGTNHA